MDFPVGRLYFSIVYIQLKKSKQVAAMIKTKKISSKLTLNALFLILTLLSIISLTLAEETLPPSSPPPVTQTAFQQDEKEFQDATLSTSAGITPDSPLYFVDTFLDNFADDATNREEKIAEMQKRKKGLVKKVVSCDDEAIAKLTWEDVLELLRT